MTTLLESPTKKTAIIPELTGGLPWLGHALAFQRNPVRFLLKGYRQLGEIFSFQLAGNPIAVLMGPKPHEAFFRATDDQLSAKEAYQFTVPIFGDDIAYDAPPKRMEEQLNMIIPAMFERRLRKYVEYINEEIENYLPTLGDSGQKDILELTNELTVFVASRCLIGREFRQNLSTEFAHLYHDLESALNLLGFFWPNLPLPSFKKRDRARVRLVEMISEIITARRKSGVVEEDFLQTLMTAEYGDGSTLNNDNITGLLLTLIFAGQHTSAVLAAWTGIELMLHPQYLDRVRREQNDVWTPGESLSFNVLREMKELERALKESERLHPPLILLMRKVIGEFSYRNYRVPEGWLTMVSPGAAHRLPSVFTDPNKFDPDRFAPGREEERKQRFTMITFGGGRHGCLGQSFAYLQIKAIWSQLLRHYDWELVHTNPKPDYNTFVVGPKPPCVVRYRRR